MRSLPLLFVALFQITAFAEAPLANRVKATVESKLAGTRARIIDADTLQLNRGDWQVTVSLANTRRVCNQGAQVCADTIDGLVANLKQAMSDVIDAKQVLLTLKTTEWLAETDAMLKKKAPDQFAANRIVSAPFVRGLVVVLVVDRPDGMSMLRFEDLTALKLTADQAHALALNNLRTKYKVLMEMKELGQKSGFWTNASAAEDYAAALTVLPELWQPLSKRVKGSLVVATPARNMVLATGDHEPALVEVMAMTASDQMKQVDHPLSDVLLTWTPQGFKRR